MPPEQPYRIVEHTWIPMRDNVRLSARMWIPEGGSPSPAVLESIPYRKRDLYRPYDDIWGKALAAAGIAFVRVDVRGSGDSEGVMTDEYSENELRDCVEAIAWIASQPWCTGAVGMRGISWGGINTLQVAARRPPELKAIVSMGTCDRRYTDDAHYIGGSLGRTNFQWGVLFKTVMAGPPDPEIVGPAWRDMWRKRLEATPPILTTWTQHQREDAYWRRGSVAEDYTSIDVPALLVSGWSDTYCVPVLRLLARLKSPARALVGPWGHTYPYTAQPVGLAWAQEEVRWWRHWLVGEPTGFMAEPALRAFMPYATAAEARGKPIPGRWVAERHWPPKRAHRRFFLNAGSLDATAAPPVIVTHNDKGVVGTTKPEWLDRLPIEQSYDDKRSTVFDSAALEAPLEILGSPVVRLRISSDQPVAKVALRLTEVRPDGSSRLVTWAVLNLTRRNSMSEPEALSPGKAYEVPVTLRTIAHRFSAGSRIRLALSEALWPMVWPSPVRPTLHIETGVSHLDLPVRIAERQAPPFPVDEVRSQAEPPPVYEPGSADASGRIKLINDAPYSSYRIDGADVELSSEREEVCEIDETGPGQSLWRQRVRSGWRRDGWNCEVEASYQLEADAGNFRLSETLKASENGKETFTRTSETAIPRDLI